MADTIISLLARLRAGEHMQNRDFGPGALSNKLRNYAHELVDHINNIVEAMRADAARAADVAGECEYSITLDGAADALETLLPEEDRRS